MVAASLRGLGGLALRQERPAEALPLLERAIVIFDAKEGIQVGELSCRWELAQALELTGGDMDRAESEAAKAAKAWRERGKTPEGSSELAGAEAFLARRAADATER